MKATIENPSEPSEMERLEMATPTFIKGIEEKVSVDELDEVDEIFLPIELDGTVLPYERRKLLERMVRKYEPEHEDDETSVYKVRPHRHYRHEDRFWDPKLIPHRVLLAELPTDGLESTGFIRRPQDRDYDAAWRKFLSENEQPPFAVPVFEAAPVKHWPENPHKGLEVFVRVLNNGIPADIQYRLSMKMIMRAQNKAEESNGVSPNGVAVEANRPPGLISRIKSLF